jgi:hypothetical protein
MQMPKEARTDKVRRKSHLPRDSQGFIRTQWLENFYETLYASNEPGIHIPYTVVFQYRRIYAAYYTDNEGFVQKIDKIADLGPEHVIAGVRELSPGGAKRGSEYRNVPLGCRAYYVYAKKSEDSFPITEANPDLSVEYFDDNSLTHFLTYRGKENNGVLQQFQEMSTPAVATIRAYWTEYYCNLETRMNLNRSDDPHVSLAERAVTFDGELHHSAPYPLSSRVESRIKEVISRIVGHVKDCLPSNVSIQLMVLNFRLGPKGKIWFLYCNTLKLYDSSLDFLGYGRDSDGLRPNSAKLVEASIPPPGLRGSKKRRGLVCPSCEVRLGPFDKYRVSIQQIFIHFLWHGPKEAWARLGRKVPTIPLEYGRDPQLPADTLRLFLTMDLRPSPVGKPFIWNGLIDSKTLKEFARDQDTAIKTAAANAQQKGEAFRREYQCVNQDRSTAESREAHANLDKELERIYLAKPHIKAAYRYWKATMIWLISQELETLTQENFRQERKRPLFLTAEINCCEKAMLAYNRTYEEMLEVERQGLIKPTPFVGELPTSLGRLGSLPKDLIHEFLGPQSAGGIGGKKKRLRQHGSQTARGALENAGQDHSKRHPGLGSGLVPGLPLLPPAPLDWLLTPRALPSSRVAHKMMANVQKLGGPVLDAEGSSKMIIPRGLPSVVVDANLIRQMNDHSLFFDGQASMSSGLATRVPDHS